MATLHERGAFVEETGLLFESMGMTRMAGRILGHLMMADKEMVSFEELSQALQASKSSISTNVKALTMVSYIKPVTMPGDRKTYYTLATDTSWVELYRSSRQLLIDMVNLFERASKLRVNPKDKTSQWIDSGNEFYNWFIRRIPDLFAEWEEHRKNKTI